MQSEDTEAGIQAYYYVAAKNPKQTSIPVANLYTVYYRPKTLSIVSESDADAAKRRV